MINRFKTLIALIFAFVLVFSLVSCLGESEGNKEVNIPEGDNYNDSEEYHIRFAYSYTAKVVNANDRTENKKEIKTVMSFYVPVDNNRFTEEQKGKIRNLKYNGYSFVEWYADWDTETQTGKGEKVSLEDILSKPVTSDITLYGERGDLAGEKATWSVVPIGEDGGEIIDATAEDIENAEELMVIISGEGPMFDFVHADEIDIPWYKYSKKVTKVVIEEGITTVGSNSFNGFYKLGSVEFAKTLTSINDFAFNQCTSTKFSVLRTPENLKIIKANAFSNTKIKEVYLNDGLVEIKENAFYASNTIRSIYVPESLTKIGAGAFHPGADGGKTRNHALSKIYYAGDSSAKMSEKIEIDMDNQWFEQRATVYYYTEDEAIGEDTSSPNAYWHYAELNGKTTNIPVQYCYTIKYFESGSGTPIATLRIPVEPVYTNEVPEGAEEGSEVVRVPLLDDNGVIVLRGVVDAALVRAQKEITYSGYMFDWEPDINGKLNGLEVGDEIKDDKEITCKRGNILSNYGGVVWSVKQLDDDEYALTVSIDRTAEDRVRADVADMVANGLIEKDEAQALIEEKLKDIYRIWDFGTTRDTGNLWTGSEAGATGVVSLHIDEGVEYIGSLAFAGLVSIKSVTLPESIKEVNVTAFDGCSRLVSVYTESSDLSQYKNLLKEGTLDLALTNVRATVYAKASVPTASSGHYWISIGDKVIAWVFEEENGVLRVGGDDEMVDFTTAGEAPWYSARDKITSVVFESNVTKLGTNVINGYYNVTKISLPLYLKVIPASSLAGTKLVEDTLAYPAGVLIIDDHLIKVDPTRRNTELFEMEQGILTVAEGAFAGCDAIKRLYVSQKVSYFNVGAFADSSIECVYVDGSSVTWTAIMRDFEGTDDKSFASASVYFKSNTKPTAADNANYYYKSGDEYVIWGCDCIWGDWYLYKSPTCMANGQEMRFCIYDSRHVDTRDIPKLDPDDPASHVFSSSAKKIKEFSSADCTTAEKHACHCTVPGCVYYDESTVIIKTPAWGHKLTWVYTYNEDGTVTATTNGVCSLESCDAHDEQNAEPITHKGLVWVKTKDAEPAEGENAGAPEMGYFDNQPVDKENGVVYHGTKDKPIEKPQIIEASDDTVEPEGPTEQE